MTPTMNASTIRATVKLLKQPPTINATNIAIPKYKPLSLLLAPPTVTSLVLVDWEMTHFDGGFGRMSGLRRCGVGIAVLKPLARIP